MLDFLVFVLLIGFLAGGMTLFIILASATSARNGGPRVRMGGRRSSGSRFRSHYYGADPGIHHSPSSWDYGSDGGHGGSSGSSDWGGGGGGGDSGGGDSGGGGGGD